jgi:zinc protease
MEADRMRNLTFDGFEEERNVVIEERRWRTENDQRGALWEALFSTVFWAHPYRNPVIGWRSDLENVSLEKVKQFYETYYAPNNAYLIVVGDVKAEEVFKIAEKYFGKYESKEIPKFYTTEPKQRGPRRTEIKKEGFATYIALAYRVPKASSEYSPAVSLLADILGGGKTSKLYKSIVYNKQLASSISAFYYGLKDEGLLIIFATLQQGKDINELEKAINEEIENLRKNKVSEEELRRAKNSQLANLIYSRESVVRLGFQLGDALINTENPNYINEYPKLIQKVSKQDIEKIINEYINDDNKTTVIVHPIPPSDIQAYIEGLKKASEIRR